jgi:hypothetical protein
MKNYTPPKRLNGYSEWERWNTFCRCLAIAGISKPSDSRVPKVLLDRQIKKGLVIKRKLGLHDSSPVWLAVKKR